MRDVSQMFKNSCNDLLADSQVKVFVSRNQSTATLVTLTSGDFIEDTITINSQATSSSSFTIGGVCSSKLTLRLTREGINKLKSLKLLAKGICLKIVQWNKVADTNQSDTDFTVNKDGSENTTGKCKLGVFYITGIENNDYYCDVEAYDAMLAFDKSVNAKQLIYMQETKLSAINWVKYIVNQCNSKYGSFNVEFDNALVNINVNVCISDDSKVETFREALGYLTTLMCGFATFDSDGNLVIRAFKYVPQSLNISHEKLLDGRFDGQVSAITGFYSSVAGFDYESTGQLIDDANDIDIYVSENPWLRGLQEYNVGTMNADILKALQATSGALMTKRFFGCDITLANMPYLELGDCIEVERLVVAEDGSHTDVVDSNIIVCDMTLRVGISCQVRSNSTQGSTSSKSAGKTGSDAKVQGDAGLDTRLDDLIAAFSGTRYVTKTVEIPITYKRNRQWELPNRCYLGNVSNINMQSTLQKALTYTERGLNTPERATGLFDYSGISEGCYTQMSSFDNAPIVIPDEYEDSIGGFIATTAGVYPYDYVLLDFDVEFGDPQSVLHDYVTEENKVTNISIDIDFSKMRRLATSVKCFTGEVDSIKYTDRGISGGYQEDGSSIQMPSANSDYVRKVTRTIQFGGNGAFTSSSLYDKVYSTGYTETYNDETYRFSKGELSYKSFEESTEYITQGELSPRLVMDISSQEYYDINLQRPVYYTFATLKELMNSPFWYSRSAFYRTRWTGEYNRKPTDGQWSVHKTGERGTVYYNGSGQDRTFDINETSNRGYKSNTDIHESLVVYTNAPKYYTLTYTVQETVPSDIDAVINAIEGAAPDLRPIYNQINQVNALISILSASVSNNSEMIEELRKAGGAGSGDYDVLESLILETRTSLQTEISQLRSDFEKCCQECKTSIASLESRVSALEQGGGGGGTTTKLTLQILNTSGVVISSEKQRYVDDTMYMSNAEGGYRVKAINAKPDTTITFRFSTNNTSWSLLTSGKANSSGEVYISTTYTNFGRYIKAIDEDGNESDVIRVVQYTAATASLSSQNVGTAENPNLRKFTLSYTGGAAAVGLSPKVEYRLFVGSTTANTSEYYEIAGYQESNVFDNVDIGKEEMYGGDTSRASAYIFACMRESIDNIERRTYYNLTLPKFGGDTDKIAFHSTMGYYGKQTATNITFDFESERYVELPLDIFKGSDGRFYVPNNIGVSAMYKFDDGSDNYSDYKATFYMRSRSGSPPASTTAYSAVGDQNTTTNYESTYRIPTTGYYYEYYTKLTSSDGSKVYDSEPIMVVGVTRIGATIGSTSSGDDRTLTITASGGLPSVAASGKTYKYKFELATGTAESTIVKTLKDWSDDKSITVTKGSEEVNNLNNFYIFYSVSDGCCTYKFRAQII